MARTNGTWVEYTAALNRDVTVPAILRTFSSEINAWRSAGPNGNLALFVEFGDTVEEAIAKRDAESQTAGKARGAKVEAASS